MNIRRNNTQRGFTLVELLVAISIVAILAVIGLTIFSGLQKGARDSRRVSDVQAAANAMEANYGKTTLSTNPAGSSGQYAGMQAGFFAQGVIPEDPMDGQTTACNGHYCGYCVLDAAASCVAGDADLGNNVPAANDATWFICANLEGPNSAGNDFVCAGARQ